MKLKFALCCLFFASAVSEAAAADAGLRYIQTRGVVRCGTDLSAKTYAYKDADGYWRGIDADLCRTLAAAVLGDKERIEMVNVTTNMVSKYLTTNKIDVMLGGAPYSAGMEISSQATPVDVIYYDKQMFLARNADKAGSMEDYRGQKVCVVNNSEDQYNLEEYNARYNLDLKPLPFASSQRAKEAFLLNRCTLLTGNALYLTNTLKSANIKDENTRVLPEVISVKPVYAFASKNNNALRISAKWILNALKLAEDIGINSSNIDIFIGVEDTSTKNLLGVNAALWNRFKVRDPQWVRKALKEIGNYGEIYEKNLGRESEFKLEREQNRLLKDGGLIIPQPFL